LLEKDLFMGTVVLYLLWIISYAQNMGFSEPGFLCGFLAGNPGR
jgi:hypothetical protein